MVLDQNTLTVRDASLPLFARWQRAGDSPSWAEKIPDHQGRGSRLDINIIDKQHLWRETVFWHEQPVEAELARRRQRELVKTMINAYRMRVCSPVMIFMFLCAACDDGKKKNDPSNNVNNTNNTNNTNPVGYPDCAGARFFISPSGDDENMGSEGEPFATLHQAAEAVATELGSYEVHPGGFIVCVEDGTYRFQSTLRLDAGHDGLEDSPIQWVARNKGGVILSGAARVPTEAIGPISPEDADYALFPAQAQEHVFTFQAAAAGVSDTGVLSSRGYHNRSNPSAMELVIHKKRGQLARWPDRGVTDTLAVDFPATVSGDRFGVQTDFAYIGSLATGNADDGAPNYHASVGGVDYYLYHCTWVYDGATHRYWFLSTADPRVQANCWPSEILSWAGSGTENIPVLSPLGPGASSSLTATNKPPDYAYHGFLRIGEVLSENSFSFPGDRYLGWTTTNLFVQGLFGNYWADDTLPAVVAGGQVTLQGTPSFGLNPRQPFSFLNVPEELDSAGEYWINHETGRVYFFSEIQPEAGAVEVTVMDTPLLIVSGGAFMEFWGLILEGTRGQLAEVGGADAVVFHHTVFRNSGLGGLVIEGRRSGVSYGLFDDTGDTALALRCGVRRTLEAGACFASDSEFRGFGFWNRTYAAAVNVAGCGNVVVHNRMHDATHSAILFTGNNHHLAFNDIGNVISESNDAGAIYTGRDWGYRGNLIEHNHIHHINSIFGGSNAVYLDDAASGITVRANLLHDISGCAILSGGGRDNLMEFNIITRAEMALCTDRRARAMANGNPGDSWNLPARLQAVHESYHHGDSLDHQSPPWSTQYPECAAIPDTWALVDGTSWLDPEGCVFARNLIWDGEGLIYEGTWGGDGALDLFADTTGNIEADPLYADPENGDMTLTPESPAYGIPGFPGIDFAAIGIREP